MGAITPDYFKPGRGTSRATKLEIAVALSDRELTRNECASALGRDWSSINNIFEQMLADGALVATAGDAPANELCTSAVPWSVVEAALEEHAPAGFLREELELLLVEAPSEAVFHRIWSEHRVNGVCQWATRLDGPRPTYLVAINPKFSPEALHSLVATQPQYGIACRRFKIAMVQTGSSLRAETRAIANAISQASAAKLPEEPNLN